MPAPSRFALRGALVVLATLPAAPLVAQNIHPTPPPEVHAVRLESPIHLDGRLDEDVWHTAPAATGFRQSQPHEGQPATQRTEVRFAYDDEALYVGARMYDDSGAAGVRTRLVRRDDDPASDYIEVIFDTYHDHLGRLFFQVNPSGARYDANGLGGGNGDASWDPVWEVKTTIDSLGWTAEMRIPFSQLRYPNTRDAQTWGLQIWRQENRLNELSQWAWWGLTESGGPSRFGHLRGLVIARSPGRGEVLPYTVARSQNLPVTDAANPFEHAHAADGRVGADATVLLTSNLTLNATVNPDFGQVEVDPAVINLSAFETFYDEHRPFFVEGGSYFSFGGLNCFFCSNVSSLSMFYSRRIGRQPEASGAVDGAGAVYSQVPDNTDILGAAKLTGRTRSGWSIGVLDAVTGRDRAQVAFADSTRGQVTVEPPANYFVGRIARDLRGGATQIRAMATSVERDLETPYLRDHLNAHSESFGLSTDSYWRNRAIHLMAQVAGTEVTADSSAMLALQESSARYFQRPDRDPHANGLLTNRFDSSLTVMRGLGAYVRLARETGNWLWEAATNVRTPGFENNDIAALATADYWYMNGNVMRQWTKPTSWYRQLYFIAGGQQQYNFDGDLTGRQSQIYGQIEPLNYWNISTFWIYRPSVYDDRLARGGPLLRVPGVNDVFLNVNGDSRKSVVLGGSLEASRDGYGDGARSASLSAQIKPWSNVSITVGPQVSHDESSYQYVTAVTDSFATAFYGTRYVFARLVQNAVSMETRVNVTFTPELTLEVYVQPLIASGAYSGFREYAAPRSSRQLVFGRDVGVFAADTVLYGPAPGDSSVEQNYIDPDGAGPAPGFAVGPQNFTVRSLRGNAVLRWEFRPGSTLFVVWTRSAESDLSRGTIAFGSDAGALFSGPSQNIFLVKVNYRIGL